MNRLILVGNGFDLAHGLKTSYKDFIFWYLDDCFDKAGIYPTTPFENEFVYIRVTDHYRLTNLSNMLNKQSFCSFLHSKGILHRYLDTELNESAERLTQQQNSIYYGVLNAVAHEVKFKSDFFKHLIFCCTDNNWVDIENEYFDQLKACKIKDEFDEEKVRLLNSEFAYLKQQLEEYLTIQQEQSYVKVIPELLSAIGSKFDIADFEPLMGYENTRISLGHKRVGPVVKHLLYFLNFNYTDVIQKYHDELGTRPTGFSKIEVNYIHGQLNKTDNPIIFGFGDEHDTQYLEFEEHRNNALFEHIKSYQYLRTPNYRNLLRFLNSGFYQVFVMGHSCGLSDRTMFKEILEHQNCKSIRLFHYNGDFHDKAINVSKHFSNKGHVRKLIVDYKAEDAFPQGGANANR
ncbi:AbiH family protein [Pedobacter sp. SL55]|uniref:AbiH family protein n=1 Tax=Pedobacter sp. SL55 TaxID=2995161 RepID=UPI0022704681|nr:AbiH family protein [Pedobacter sp. SL55]WAC42243.1 AbiH family protein [Pedobacter sp. SL55]